MAPLPAYVLVFALSASPCLPRTVPPLSDAQATTNIKEMPLDRRETVISKMPPGPHGTVNYGRFDFSEHECQLFPVKSVSQSVSQRSPWNRRWFNRSTADCDASSGPPCPPEAQVRSNLGRHSWSSTLAPHPFKNRLQAGSSRLQVSPWYRSSIPHGDACTEINCSGPLSSSLDGARWSPCAENKNKNDWATKLRHFWARHLEQSAWRFEGPFPESTCFQNKDWNHICLNNIDVWYSLNWHLPPHSS